MKIGTLTAALLALLLAAPSLNAEEATATGAIEVNVDWMPMAAMTLWPMFTVYDADWNVVWDKGPYGFGRKVVVIDEIPTGDYYLESWPFVEDCRWCGDEMQPCNIPFHPEFYDNRPSQIGAVKIHVSAPDTTRGISVYFDPDFFVRVATSPKAFVLHVDGCGFTAPLHFGWKSGDTHLLWATEFVSQPDGGRYAFNHWSQGGPREQDWTVPAGVTRDTVVARYVYEYRLDVHTDRGSPTGTGWGRAWRDSTISIDSALVTRVYGIEGTDTVSVDSLRHRFDHWTGTGLGSYTGPDNPAGVTRNGTIAERAFWTRQFPLVARPEDPSMGSVEINPPGTWHDGDSAVTVKAVPKAGYRFVDWDSTFEGTEDSIAVVMDTSKTLVARFTRLLHPPVLAIPDTCFAEDDTLRIPLAEMASWLSDPVDPPDSLDLRLLSVSPHLKTLLDESGIRFWSDPDWNGTGWLAVEASDPGGETASDTVFVVVDPVNDTPGAFRLIEPADGAELPGPGGTTFRWSASANPDAANGDEIRYTLFIAPEGEVPDSALAAADTSSVRPLGPGSYRWWVKAFDNAGAAVWAEPGAGSALTVRDTGVDDHAALPTAFRLLQNHPNPFNPVTGITYWVPRRSAVRIEIISTSGKRLKTLVQGAMDAGVHSVVWDGTDSANRPAGSGVFLCRMDAGSFTQVRKLVRVR